MPLLRVGFSPLLGGLMLVAAALNFFTFLVTNAGMQMALAAVFGLVGLLYCFGTFLVVEGHQVELKNPLGMTLKTLRFTSAHDLRLDGRTLWVQTGESKPKKISGLVARGADWRALAAAIAQAQAAVPRPGAIA